MKYNNLISVNDNFQYSVNLQFDINNISKLVEYIPTKDGCEVLKFYVTSVLKGKNRATTLIGPYGKGKSHLLLVLITLLNSYEKEDTTDINNFIKKIKPIDEELYHMLLMIREQKIKLMPIIINSNYNNLNQAFLLALSEALEREKLDQVIINNYFKIALEVIESWETNYPEMLASANKCLIAYSYSLKELKQGLKIYSEDHYEIFKKIYSCVLPGQEFNPLVNSDLIKTYKDLTHEIAKFGYHGIYIVFDEFSKFLECVENSRMMKDLKLLQDFAELAARTKTQEQIHLNCITHKTINEYIKNFTEDKVNAFKTVEGRFKEIYFNRSMEQHYEIVSYAINKKNDFNNFYQKYYQSNQKFYDKIKELTIFKDVDNIEEILYKGCFPLNPITVYALVGLSEKIAQNERTLFTFLTDDDHDGLKNFIQTNETNLFSIDKIYDYFKPLLKKETDDQIKSIWIKAENALNKLSNLTEKSIIKAIAIIYMLNETDIFVPDDNTIMLSINTSPPEYEQAVQNLIEKSILKRRKIVNYLDFATIYNRQLTKEIKTLTEEKFNAINEKEVLATIIETSYYLPRRYNEEYKMTRFFKNIFMNEEEILNLNSFNLLLDQYYCDGLVISLLKTSKDSSQVKEKFSQINSNKVILKLPKKIFSKTISNLLKEYVAIKYLKSTINNADELVSELSSMQQEIEASVTEEIKEYFSNDNIQEYLYQEESYRKINTLSSLLSDVCIKIYKHTPKINNEMINKKELTPAIKKARSIVIDTVLTNDLSLIQSPTSAEATIYKAIVDKKEEETIAPIIEIIKDFIQSSDNNKQSFSILYKKLTKEPYSIRLGLIPILISMALYDYADNIIIYFMNKEIDLVSDTLIKINENPNKYFILTEKGTTDKLKYLSNLMALYNINNIDNTRVNVKKLIDTMKRWILSLPRILRETTIDSEGITLKPEYIQIKSELLKPDINTNEFIHQTLLSIYQTNDYNTVIHNMIELKQVFDNFINEYTNHLIIETKTLINKNYKGSLTTLLKEWYDKIEGDVSKKVYDLKTKNFLDYIASFTTHDESDVMEKIANIITGFYIEDWNPLEYNNYMNELSKILENIKNADNSLEEKQKLVIITENEVIEKNLNIEEELTALGSTMKNNIEEVMDEYGDSLTEKEKINILLNILRKYL